MAEERREHQWGNLGQLYHAGNHQHGQRLHVPRRRKQLSGERDEQCLDTDGEPRRGGAHDHRTTCESDGDGRTNSDL